MTTGHTKNFLNEVNGLFATFAETLTRAQNVQAINPAISVPSLS